MPVWGWQIVAAVVVGAWIYWYNAYRLPRKIQKKIEEMEDR